MVHHLLRFGRREARAGPGGAGLKACSLTRHAGEDQSFRAILTTISDKSRTRMSDPTATMDVCLSWAVNR